MSIHILDQAITKVKNLYPFSKRVKIKKRLSLEQAHATKNQVTKQEWAIIK